LITPLHSFNVAAHFVDRNVLEGRGSKVAIECGDEHITYQQLFDRTNRAGNALLRLGVRAEDRVLVLLLDCPEFLYSYFGAIKIGAIPVPANPFLKPVEVEYLLNDSCAVAAILSDELLPQWRSISRDRVPHLREVVVADGSQKAFPRFADLLDTSPASLAPAPTRSDSPAFWLYSSGSTGVPKACIHLQRDMVVCSELYAKAILGMSSSDRCYSVARLFFAYGLGNAGYFPLGCGATTILSPARPTPAGIYADIERYRPTLFFSVPSNFAALLAHPSPGAAKDFDLSSIRCAISAGEALPAPLYQRFKQRFGIEILDSLGSTETLQMVIANRPGDVQPGSSGKLIPGYEAKILDEFGAPVAPGEIGDLFIKGDSVCAGYWNQPEKTKAVFVNGWFRTGDKYSQDAAGYYWYAGRSDNIFKVNGRWLSPAEVEGALIAHPAVREAAVIARDDESGLTKPAAYVVVNDGAGQGPRLAQELQEWVAQKAGSSKRPRWVEFLPELPKTATGKLQHYKLREMQQRHSS
jgi:benzoate-CoA ligase family protein